MSCCGSSSPKPPPERSFQGPVPLTSPPPSSSAYPVAGPSSSSQQPTAQQNPPYPPPLPPFPQPTHPSSPVNGHNPAQYQSWPNTPAPPPVPVQQQPSWTSASSRVSQLSLDPTQLVQRPSPTYPQPIRTQSPQSYTFNQNGAPPSHLNGGTYEPPYPTPPSSRTAFRPSTTSPPPMLGQSYAGSQVGTISRRSPAPTVTGNGGQRSRTTSLSARSVRSRREEQVPVLPPRRKQTEAEGKLSVGIDFGTTFSGVAYGSSRLALSPHPGSSDTQIRQIIHWPGSYETYRKVPSCILYSQEDDPNHPAEVLAWGLEAKNRSGGPGLVKCEWFKLLLSPDQLRSGVIDPRLPPLPRGKTPVDVIADYLRCLWTYARGKITDEIGSVVDLDSADVLLTVPAAWDAAGCALMREAAIQAGLVQSARGGDKNWRDRLRIITEPEAAAIHTSSLANFHHLRPPQAFVIMDAGGGTVDCAGYKLMGDLASLNMAELTVRAGTTSGGLFVDLMFEELVRSILKDHPSHLDPPSLAAFMHAFSESDKLAFAGTAEDDETLYRFNCFNPEDDHDPSIGLEYGELCIAGHVLKTQVFDPVVNQVLDLLSHQLGAMPVEVDALLLVGGFAASPYLFRRIQETFGSTVRLILRPTDPDIATLRGAARYGLGGQYGRVGSVIAPRGYAMKVKLPAEDVDRWQRPQYISQNNAGIDICMNRLSYLIVKGAVLRKGERLRSRFCKFVSPTESSVFTATLFTSDEESVYRWIDEGQTRELCTWTVDLAALPAFHEIAKRGGGYCEFDLGLELDSAEVRGVLLAAGEDLECGGAVFEFL